MNETIFKDRLKQFGLRIIRLIEALPKTRTGDVIGRQLLRSGTSIGANYRAACRGKSCADMIAKLSIVEEEADESVYWIEMLEEAGVVPAAKLAKIKMEANEIVAMTVASIKTLRKRK